MRWDQVGPEGFTLLEFSLFGIWSRECPSTRPSSRVHKSYARLNLNSQHHLFLLQPLTKFQTKLLNPHHVMCGIRLKKREMKIFFLKNVISNTQKK